MTFVLDASVAICWLMSDEQQSAADDILAKLETESAIAPGLWWYEVRNALLVNERRGRLDASRTGAALALLAKLPIAIDTEPGEDRLLALSRRHGLTAYDAAYVETAQRLNLSLATLDADMVRAARREGIELLIASF